MKKSMVLVLLALCVLLSACSENKSIGIIGGADGPTEVFVSTGEEIMYQQITQEEAKEIMDSGESYVLLDVREQDEYDAGHIPGALLIPHEQIAVKAEKMLPDKDAQILVYCRTGRRSKIAAATLSALGYTNVKEFGGITDWPYEVE